MFSQEEGKILLFTLIPIQGFDKSTTIPPSTEGS